jgi:hypothetical protein
MLLHLLHYRDKAFVGQGLIFLDALLWKLILGKVFIFYQVPGSFLKPPFSATSPSGNDYEKCTARS